MTTRSTARREAPETAADSVDHDDSAPPTDAPKTLRAPVDSPWRFRVNSFAPDMVSTPSALVRVACSVLAGSVLTFVAWFLLRSVTLAAFNASMVTRALATAGSLVVIAAAASLVWMWIRDREADPEVHRHKLGPIRPRWRTVLTEAVCAMAPAGLIITSIGIPLSATKLYLDGIQVDQGFRTQFLTRMTETASHQDMNYVDLPSFYPIGWFWLGGRMADLMGFDGWEVYQPWALVSLAAAASALVPIWRKLTGSLPVATAIAIVTTAIILTEVPEEPYAAVVAMGAPVAVVLGYRAVRGSWLSTLALTLYLGVSACFYTLYTGIIALTMVVFAFTAFLTFGRTARSFVPLRQLAVMGIGSILIALLSWWPYLSAVADAEGSVTTTAQHFLPSQGAIIPMPFFELSMVGLLSLIGLIYIAARYNNPEISYFGLAVGVCYVWVVASMVVTVAGTTLLGFRVEVLIALLLSTAGVLALADLRLVGVDMLYPEGIGEGANRSITAAFVVLFAAAGLAYIQQIPAENQAFIDEAYASTDGNGERADKRQSDVGRYYSEMDEFIRSQGYTPSETVLYTDEINFMAYHPYHGFNAFTSHYANPLGEFTARNDQLSRWAVGSHEDLAQPEKFLAALEDSRWRAPDGFIFRGSETDPDAPWKTHIAHDIFPNEPNVRYEALNFNPEAFNSPEWTKKQFGPFVVVIRNR